MGKIIAFANQKGGVGKTTSALNIAAAIGQAGKRALICDMDPQGNASSGVGVNKKKLPHSIYDVLINRSSPSEAVVHTEFAGLDIMASSVNLAGAEVDLISLNDEQSKFRLRDALESISSEYDYIIIDCPPSLGYLTLNALCAANSIIVPMQCEFYALEGLSQLTHTIKQIKRLYNPSLELEGVLITMFDGRLNLTLQVLDEIKKFFPGKIFESVIPRNVRLSEAPSFGQPVIYFDKASKGSIAYVNAADEIMRKNAG